MRLLEQAGADQLAALLHAEQFLLDPLGRHPRRADHDERAAARGLQLCSSRAATSLPTPAGPVISTRLPVAATRFSVARTLLIAAEVPVSSISLPICWRKRLVLAPQPLGLGGAADQVDEMARPRTASR